jgi:alpha-L-fucosidase
MVDSKGTLLPWEACVTLNSTWGYNANDRNFKSPQHIIRALVECTSKGGNLLLNIGPDAKGNIQKEAIELLTKVGEWMDYNSASIYGCTRSEFPKPEWGRYTQNGNKLYAHILDRGINAFNFQGLKSVAKRARMLCDGSELELSVPRDAMGFLDDIFADRLPQHLPDENDTVVEITLKEDRSK